MKIPYKLLRMLLLSVAVFLPLSVFALDTGTGGSSLPGSQTQTQQKMNPSTQKPGNETSTGMSASGPTFGIYYGNPYNYSPYYHSYYSPYAQSYYSPYSYYNPYAYSYYYNPYYHAPYNYYHSPYNYYYPYRPFYFQHYGW